jgi:hypothetical protein
MEVATEGRRMRHMCQRVAIGLHQLQILQPPTRKARSVSHAFEHSGMAQEWYEWSVAWYEQVVDLTPHQRRQYIGRLLVIGRWLSQQVPEVRTCTVDRGSGSAFPRRCLFLDGWPVCKRGGATPDTSGQSRASVEATGHRLLSGRTSSVFH